MTIYLEIHNLRDSLRVRRSEWGLAIILAVGWGYLPLLTRGNSFGSPSLSWLNAMVSETTWATACLLIGSARLTVLYINGQWIKCAHARVATAFLSCLIWTTLFLGLLNAGTATPGIITYFVFLVMDMHTIYEAGQDARHADEKSRDSRT